MIIVWPDPSFWDMKNKQKTKDKNKVFRTTSYITCQLQLISKHTLNNKGLKWVPKRRKLLGATILDPILDLFRNHVRPLPQWGCFKTISTCYMKIQTWNKKERHKPKQSENKQDLSNKTIKRVCVWNSCLPVIRSGLDQSVGPYSFSLKNETPKELKGTHKKPVCFLNWSLLYPVEVESNKESLTNVSTWKKAKCLKTKQP
jgi:hypothetical protein